MAPAISTHCVPSRTTALSIADIEGLTQGQPGVVDVACPLCGPDRTSMTNRTRRVLRVWREGDGSAGYYCARCGARGHAVGADTGVASRDLPKVAVMSTATQTAASRRARARRLWESSSPVSKPVVRYLREVRAFYGPIPATVRGLPARGSLGPAMVAAFGEATEIDPGTADIAIAAVEAIHITRLKSDGSGKDGANAKLMVGPAKGAPIVLAHPNDSLGLAVVEGIETGLSVLEATGLGVWVAGSAGMMPALADRVPRWIDCLSIVADPDPAGRVGAAGLAAGLRRRGIHVEIRVLDGGTAWPK